MVGHPDELLASRHLGQGGVTEILRQRVEDGIEPVAVCGHDPVGHLLDVGLYRDLRVGCVGVAEGEAAIGARGPGSCALCGQTWLLSGRASRRATEGGKLIAGAAPGEDDGAAPAMRSAEESASLH